jgi:uncharacterized membrane protein YwaF
MTRKEAIRAAQADVRAGKDRKAVFETYKPMVPRHLHLASAIASVPREEAKSANRVLNLVLVGLLVLAGLLKAVGLFGALASTNVLLAVGISIVSVAVPFLFAYEVNRFNGQIYGILTILAAASLLNVLLHLPEAPVSGLIFAVLLGAILGLSIVLRTKVAPAFKAFGVKTDGSGNYLLG